MVRIKDYLCTFAQKYKYSMKQINDLMPTPNYLSTIRKDITFEAKK
jgi:hypothetical protein